MNKTQKNTAHIQTVKDGLKHIFDLIDRFTSLQDSNTVDIDFDLTNKQRSFVHEYAQNLGFLTESIPIKGSMNKKIRVYRKTPGEKRLTTRLLILLVKLV